MQASRFPAAVAILWLASTLWWWAFAFTPLPSEPPAWLAAARSACFGSLESGLPEGYGWMLLTLGPASFLAAILVLWGPELGPSLRSVTRGPLGRGLLGILALAAVGEGVWVAGKVHAARAVTAWARGVHDVGPLPAGYPRHTELAPEFVLLDQHGTRVSLERLRGQPVLLTFVFAHCQTMCPLIVDTLKRAAPGAAPVEVLLVTLDPWRDTPSTLPGIAARWNVPTNFHVLSAHGVAEVLRVVEAYGVPFERDEVTGDITHPGLVFLIDASGRLAYTFNDPPPEWVREALARLGRPDARNG